MAKTAAAPNPAATPEEILKPLAGQVVPAKKLGSLLVSGGHNEPAAVVSGLLDRGEIKALGNTSADGDKRSGFRFFVPAFLPGGKVWIRALHGPAVKVPRLGKFDRFGRVAEVTGKQRAWLESREVPAEVIADPAEVAKLEAEAERRAALKAKVIDKREAILAELG